MNDMRKRAGRKVAVLGPIPRDQVVTHAGERFHKYGCVLYTAAALSALLEPDDTSDAYHVRLLSLDAKTGALSWDRNTSHGTFPLPVSAAVWSSRRHSREAADSAVRTKMKARADRMPRSIRADQSDAGSISARSTWKRSQIFFEG